MSNGTDYGLWGGLVSSIGSLIAVASAIIFTWTRNTKWVPPEDALPTSPARVASLITAIGVGYLWYETGKSLSAPDLEKLAAVCGASAVFFFLFHVIIMTIYVFDLVIATSLTTTESRRTLGGFWLKPVPRQKLKSGEAETIQEFLTGVAYDKDRVWPRGALSLVKVVSIVAYLGLTFTGSCAIAAISLSIDPAAAKASSNQTNQTDNQPTADAGKVKDPPTIRSPATAHGNQPGQKAATPPHR